MSARYRGGTRNSRTIYLGDTEVGYANDRETRDALIAYANAGLDALAGAGPRPTAPKAPTRPKAKAADRPPTPLGDDGTLMRRTHDRVVHVLDRAGAPVRPAWIAARLGIDNPRELDPYLERLREHGTIRVARTVGTTPCYVLHPGLRTPA